jgi:trans-aconitate 2-methyltransferase
MSDGSYQWSAGDYAENSSAQFEWARELIAKLNLRGGEAVLDIGCGDGKVSAAIARCLPHGFVVAIDSSREMIELANRNHSREAFSNITFQLMDARSIQFSEKFDVVFSNAVLHWIPDHRPVLKGIKASMKKGGRILFQMGGQGNAEEVFAAAELLIAQEPWSGYFKNFSFPYRFYGAEKYGRLLVETGFEANRIELIPKDMTQRGKEGLTGWIRTTWLPYTERIPNHLREEFVSAIADRYIKTHSLDAEGMVHVSMVRLEVEATKS